MFVIFAQVYNPGCVEELKGINGVILRFILSSFETIFGVGGFPPSGDIMEDSIPPSEVDISSFI